MPNCRRSILLVVLLSVSGGASLRASDEHWRPASAPFEGLHGDPLADPLDFSLAERQLFSDARSGRLNQLSLIDAALVACGDDYSARYQRQFKAVCEELRQLAIQRADVAGRIELVHHLLHQRILRGGYDANATDLAATFDTGVYNCASATLLFIALAEQLNLNAHAIELPGHVRAVIDCSAGRCEIEPTCPTWSGAVRWESPASRQSQRPEEAREISAPGLIAMIYYNRGVDAFYHRRYAEAVAVNRKALLLDPSNSTARGNLLAAVNNWALALAAEGRFAEAEQLLADGRRFAPDHLPFVHNAAHVQRMQAQAQISPVAAPLIAAPSL